MATISPDEKYRLLVSKWGVEETKKRIAELKAQGRVASNLRAVDLLYQEVQWELVEGNVALQGFYLGTYKRGPPGLEVTETYLLAKGGVTTLRFDNPEILLPLDEEEGHGVLASVSVTKVDRVKNVGTGEVQLRVNDGAEIARVNLPPQLMSDWAIPLDEVADTPKPVLVVEAIAEVRDVVPPSGWQEVDGGRRQRVAEVAPLPIVTKKGEINLQLQLGGDGGRVSAKVNSGEELLLLLDTTGNMPDTEDPQQWFDWIQERALTDHEKVLAELRSLAGRQIVVFGSGGSEIQRKDAKGKREILQLSGSFITTKQFGFMISYKNACALVTRLAQGEPVAAARPSAAVAPAPGAAKPAQEVKVPIQDAVLATVGENGATQGDVKKLLRTYNTEELVDGVEALVTSGTIRFDRETKRYVMATKKE